MRDTQLVCIAALVVAVYAIHQFTVGGDGVIMGSVLLTLGGIAGVKLERYFVRKSLISDKNPGENAPIDEGEDID